MGMVGLVGNTVGPHFPGGPALLARRKRETTFLQVCSQKINSVGMINYTYYL